MKNNLSKITVFILFIFVWYTFIPAQKFMIYQGDTINRIDATNKKQGKWIFFSKINRSKIIKKGSYVNSKKEGIWKSYYPNGKVKTIFPYVNNKIKGYAKIYYETGILSEEGMWKGNRWVGEYKFYHENGKPAYIWKFANDGKRTGKQQYFYSSGQLRIVGEWNGGKESGVVKEYYENGTIKSEKHYDNGAFSEVKSKTYENTESIENNEVNTTTENTNTETEVSNKPNEAFTGNGYYQLKNKEGKIEWDGKFKNGRFFEGKRYYYGTSGKLLKTVFYEKTKITKTVRNK